MDSSFKNALASATHSHARSSSSAQSHTDCDEGQQGTYQQEERDFLKRTKHYRSSLPFPFQKERDHCRGYTNILTRILRKFYENLCHIPDNFMPVLHQLPIAESLAQNGST